jgi:hypothetical protein
VNDADANSGTRGASDHRCVSAAAGAEAAVACMWRDDDNVGMSSSSRAISERRDAFSRLCTTRSELISRRRSYRRWFRSGVTRSIGRCAQQLKPSLYTERTVRHPGSSQVRPSSKRGTGGPSCNDSVRTEAGSTSTDSCIGSSSFVSLSRSFDGGLIPDKHPTQTHLAPKPSRAKAISRQRHLAPKPSRAKAISRQSHLAPKPSRAKAISRRCAGAASRVPRNRGGPIKA